MVAVGPEVDACWCWVMVSLVTTENQAATPMRTRTKRSRWGEVEPRVMPDKGVDTWG